jgi:hypothetical protein
MAMLSLPGCCFNSDNVKRFSQAKFSRRCSSRMREVLDVFDPLARHTLTTPGSEPEIFTTELAPLHRTILKLLRFPQTDYHT